MRTRSVSSIDVDGIEVELDHSPEYFEPITIQPTPDTLVVGYLLYDQDCENPLTSYDGEGRLYTKPPYYANESSITDDRSAPCKLGLNEFGSRGYDPEYDLELDGIEERVVEKMGATVREEQELSTWMVARVLEFGGSFEDVLEDFVQLVAYGHYHTRHDWPEDSGSMIVEHKLDYETLAKQAWEELYAEGKIGEYLAVPVNYCHSVHGPGTTRIYTASLDNANAVWVPGKCCIENMNFDGCVTYLDKLAVADKYAASVLEEYVKWCNGECYGIVVETFVLSDDGESYEKVGETDSCWGFIGQEWAEQALKEQMEFEINRFKTEKEAA